MPAERGKPFRACEVEIEMRENYGVVLPPHIHICECILNLFHFSKHLSI